MELQHWFLFWLSSDIQIAQCLEFIKMFMDSGLSSTAMLIFQNVTEIQDLIAKFSAFIANQNKMIHV